MDGIELKTRRNIIDLTQQGLADEFGVERNTINRWENGILKIIPKWVNLALLTLERRHENKADDKPQDEKLYYNKSQVKRRGWTDAMIRDLLSEVEMKRGLTCSAGQRNFNFQYYYEDTKVEAIEKTKAFTDWKRKKNKA